MTHKLPPQLLALFAARPGLRYIPHNDHAAEERKTHEIGGVAQYLDALKTYRDEAPQDNSESWFEKKIRLKAEKRERLEKTLQEGLDRKPDDDPNIRGDAFKTLFVARLSYDTKEKDLEREFGRFGPIERIRIVKDETDLQTNGTASRKPKKKKAHKGYAFIVYEREKDMKAAYKETDGIRIKDRRILVDVERGRTVKGWKPRRLGGGLGGRGYTKTTPARPMGGNFGGPGGPAGPGGYGGGFRGGFRGGSRGGNFGGGGYRGDRNSYGGGRGGLGYQGGGGFGGGRGGYGAPPNAPAGPGGRSGSGGAYGGPEGATNGDGPRGGYGGDRGRNDYDDRSSYRNGGGYNDRSRGFTGSNSEPIRPREDRGGDRDRGYGRRDDDYGRPPKRHYEGGYDDDPRKRRY